MQPVCTVTRAVRAYGSRAAIRRSRRLSRSLGHPTRAFPRDLRVVIRLLQVAAPWTSPPLKTHFDLLQVADSAEPPPLAPWRDLQLSVGAPRRPAREARRAPRTRRTQARSN